ncbi:MAG: hypothetical protein J0M24_05675 [Verrucomicrobia bacterium]|nr:hypothetical protein [Verrucomicrobiota bacterium]
MAGLIDIINRGNTDSFIVDVISTYDGRFSNFDLDFKPIYLQFAVRINAFCLSIGLDGYDALFGMLDDSSMSMDLDSILYALCEIEGKQECEWMMSLKELMPGAMFPRSADVARGISRELEEELHSGVGRSGVIAGLCERSHNNKWDTKGCFHRWAVVNQQRIVLDIYRRDVVNLLSRFSTTAPVGRC